MPHLPQAFDASPEAEAEAEAETEVEGDAAAALDDVALLTVLPQAASSRLVAANAVASMTVVPRVFVMCHPFG